MSGGAPDRDSSPRPSGGADWSPEARRSGGLDRGLRPDAGVRRRPHGSRDAEARREVDEELRFHLEMRERLLVEQGWSPEAARVEALARFGDLDGTVTYCTRQTAERRRRETTTMRLDALKQDLRWALRTLRRGPGYALVVVATLAIAIAANVTIFAVMNPYFLRPLPYAQADALVQLGKYEQEDGWDGMRFSLPQVADVRGRARSLADVETYHYRSVNLADEGVPDRVMASIVSGGMFELLGVEPALGRTFGAGEAGPAGAHVAVISDRLWRTRYGSNAGVVGRAVRIDGAPFTVVGVMGPEFSFPFNGVRLWVPDRRDPAAVDRAVENDLPVARLADGWTRAAAIRELNAIQAELGRAYPTVDGAYRGVSVTPIREALSFGWDPLRIGFTVSLGAVAALLLIACVNVAGMNLARATAREREVALRAALGAGRRRIVRQLFTESLVLVVLAGVSGVALARVAVRAVAPILPEDLYRVGDASVDGVVLAFTVGLTAVAALAFGLAPAFASVGRDLASSMRAAAGSGERPARLLGRRALVSVQVALALVLLTGAGMMLRVFTQVRALDFGFDADRVLTVEVTPAAGDYPDNEQVGAYFRTARETVAAIPGVRAVGDVAWMPMNHETAGIDWALPEQAGTPPEQWPYAQHNRAGPGWFEAMGIDRLAGRDFAESDAAGAAPVAIVSRALAERAWPEAEAVGRTLLLNRGPEEPPLQVSVIGVVADVQHGEDLGEPHRMVYRPLAQEPVRRRFLSVGTSGPAGELVRPVRDALLALDPDLPVTLRPLPEIVRETTIGFSLGATLLGLFGGIGLLLSTLGLYGLLAYTVARRRREMGVRLALGASRARLFRMVVGEGLRLTLLGAVAGLALAVGLGRVAVSVFPSVPAPDPATLAAVTVLFLMVAGVASALPPLRNRADPQEALRSE